MLNDTAALHFLPVVSDPWGSQEKQQEASRGTLQYHLLIAAKLAWAPVADKRKLSLKVVLGIVPVSDSVFLARPCNYHGLWGTHPLCLRKSLNKCVNAIRRLVIAIISSLKSPAYMPRVFKTKIHVTTSTFKGKLELPKRHWLWLVWAIFHIYKWQRGNILCPQQAVQSTKLNSATQLSLTECWISERICILEKCMHWWPAFTSE